MYVNRYIYIYSARYGERCGIVRVEVCTSKLELCECCVRFSGGKVVAEGFSGVRIRINVKVYSYSFIYK